MKILALLFFVIFNKLSATVLLNGDQGFRARNDAKFRVMTISLIWLKELEDTYKSGFPKNFGATKFRNLSTVPNHNVPSGDASTCQNVTFFSVEQNRRLINKYGWDFVFNATTREMLDNPRARLFRYKYHDEMEDYHFLRSERQGMCTTLRKLRRRVESVFTFEKCIRLFERPTCKGWSLAVYPGSGNSEELMGPRDVTFQAIGPCFTNEFAGGSFNESFPTFIFKNPELRIFNPDLAESPTYITSGLKAIDHLFYRFSLGPKNRIQQISALQTQSQGILHTVVSVSPEDVSFLKSPQEENGDIVGYAIPPKFGGTTKEAFNQFRASSLSLNHWDNVLSGFVDNHSWLVHLKFEYENDNETRPLYFYYSIRLSLIVNLSQYGYKQKWYYGCIINEQNTKLKRDQPYVQDKERRKVTVKNLHYIHMNFSPVFQKLESLTFRILPGSNYNNVMENRMRKILSCQEVISSGEVLNKHKGLSDISITKNGMGPSTSKNSADEQIFTEMFYNPMVRLFTGENFSGTFEDYHSGIARKFSGCHNTKQVQNVNSAATLNKCTRLFTNSECRGLSLAIYPGHENSGVPLNTILRRVLSVGPCVLPDFTQAKKSSNAFPDLFTISEISALNASLYRTDILHVRYLLGPKNRTEHIHASIFQPGLVDITKRFNVGETEFYKSRDKKKDDVPSYAIPIEIGGPQESFNIFPMNESLVDTWAQIFPNSFSDRNDIFYWYMSFKFVYNTDSQTRPVFIYYYFKDEQHEHISYEQFTNY